MDTCTNNYISVYVLLIIAINQVTGVALMCESVGLINQCAVTWNVSAYKVISYVFMYNYTIYIVLHKLFMKHFSREKVGRLMALRKG